MRVAIMGSGGIGGPLGASLAQARDDVTFIARGAHLDAIRRNGFRVEGERGTIHIHPANATANPAEIGVVDLVLFCVKLWDVEAAGEAIRPIVGPDTTVIPLQNGIDAPERLAAILGPRAVMGGVAMVGGNIAAPGHPADRSDAAHHLWRTRRRAQPEGPAAPRTLPGGRLRRCSRRRHRVGYVGKIQPHGAVQRPVGVDPPAP